MLTLCYISRIVGNTTVDTNGTLQEYKVIQLWTTMLHCKNSR